METNNYPRYLHLRLTDKMFADIEKNANELGYNKSRWLREVIKLALKNDSILNANLQYVESKRIHSQIKAIGNNLNQIARKANTTGDIENLENIQNQLEEIKRKL
ncbi:plasmid mobilization relaxosome protein MobC [Thalassospira sp. ER-Se-21-Dark]|uniref:plasmid mobilization relaxosome protein MobC n=1 Tax=Thalassospira sp. ER-Se-21-Dark TaxID=2585190 RepID=UPI001B3090EA|nr:plasmid mobilization relaxosome protein MobC [Thalassospira sp. ER-Se-21-Dark]MBP3127969.1 MobC family plasmid mobilization relaxosome protein [Thalassospira sp. ER-Se-21-Dark]